MGSRGGLLTPANWVEHKNTRRCNLDPQRTALKLSPSLLSDETFVTHGLRVTLPRGIWPGRSLWGSEAPEKQSSHCVRPPTPGGSHCLTFPLGLGAACWLQGGKHSTTVGGSFPSVRTHPQPPEHRCLLCCGRERQEAVKAGSFGAELAVDTEQEGTFPLCSLHSLHVLCSGGPVYSFRAAALTSLDKHSRLITLAGDSHSTQPRDNASPLWRPICREGGEMGRSARLSSGGGRRGPHWRQRQDEPARRTTLACHYSGYCPSHVPNGNPNNWPGRGWGAESLTSLNFPQPFPFQQDPV